MFKQTIIQTVKKIILQHAKPNRIYLYGSQANGQSKHGSDIDIAYDDENFKHHHLIMAEVEKIESLIKIDVHNLASTGDRFTNRVKSSAKILYSATKALRAEDALYNFSNALDKFNDIIDRKESFEQAGFADVYLDLIVKRFEFSFEMSWKSLKRYLEFIGLSPKSPRATFQEAYAQNIIQDETIWLDMIEQRNLSSHIYDEYQIREILDKLEKYQTAFMLVKAYLDNALSAQHTAGIVGGNDDDTT